MTETVLRNAQIFLAENSHRYQALVEQIRAACESIAHDQPQAVRRIYGRDEKQEGARLAYVALKAPNKITKKWTEDFGGTGPFSQLPDIAGLTMVVYYPHQISQVIKRVTDMLATKRIDADNPKVKKTNGYFATHVVLTSRNIDHVGLRCELQVKTMLHEAWSSKTHDLIYKPRVRNDARMTRIMNSIADAIESIEVQSETLRELIFERWNAERTWLTALRKYSFRSLPVWVKNDVHSEEAKAIRGLMENNEAHLRNAPHNDGIYQDIAVRIHNLCETSIREGYLLEAYLAIIRDREIEREKAIEQALRWLSVVQAEFSQGRAKSYEVWSIPLVLQGCGDLSYAISAGRRLLNDVPSLSEGDKQIVAFNLANHLVEDAYFEFPWRQDEWSESVKRRFERVKSEVEELLKFAAPQRVGQAETAFLDLEGMQLVVFEQSPARIREGIDKITAGNTNVRESEREAAQAYFDLHIRLAWRRLLDLETQDALKIPEGGG